MDARLEAARARLEQQLLPLPQVRLIDVGCERGTQAFFFRVHLVPGTDRDKLPIPDQVDGVPVRVLFGDYRLE